MQVRLLGPVDVEVDGAHRPIPGKRRSTLAAVLALHPGEVVDTDRLVAATWGESTPPAPNTVQTQLSYLRRAFGLAIEARSPGYRLELGGDGTDVLVAERLLRQAARETDLMERAGCLETALTLWRGRPLANVALHGWSDEYVSRLDQLRQQITGALIDVRLALGHHTLLLPQLRELVRDQPFDEHRHSQLMLALYRAGRQADALAVYQEVRTALLDGLGVDPGPALRDQHAAILRQDRSLDLVTPAVLGSGDPSIGRAATPPATTGPVPPRRRLAGALPAGTGTFTGRAREIEQITAAASSSRVLLIHAVAGMPGVGKTALALHVAHRLGTQFPDGHVFVDLHGHTAGRSPAEPGDVLAVLLAADGVHPRRLPTDTESRSALWRRRLADRRALIVLDNAVDSAQVAPLLPASAGCLVLVTSRRFLGDLPTDAVRLVLDALTAKEAEEMFIRLAPHAAGQTEQVGDLVAACGHLPLAVSLLARLLERHRGWSVTDLLRETRTRLLDVAAEHASVGAAFDLSYRYLPPARQLFLRRLALHPGTEIEPYAAAALADVPLAEATQELDALHTDSLLIEVGYHRYAMHDLIRSYARTLAAGDPAVDRQAATARLLDFYQRVALLANARLSRLVRPATRESDPPRAAGDPDLADFDGVLSWLRTERANLLACLATSTDRLRTVRLTAGLCELLRRDGPWTQAMPLHLAAIRAAIDLGDELEQANGLIDLATVRRLSGDYPGAQKDIRRALDLYRRLGHRRGAANALTELGKALSRAADYAAAAATAEQARDLYRTLGDRAGEAGALVELAIARGMTSDFQAAQDLLRQGLGLYRQCGDRSGQAYALRILGIAHGRVGDFSGALDLLQPAMELYEQLNIRCGQALTLTDIGRSATGVGDYPRAVQALRSALGLHRAMDYRVGQSMALLYLGIALRRSGDLPAAAAALSEALTLDRRIRNRSGQAMALNEMGALHRLAGRPDQADAAHQEALELADLIPSPWDRAQSLAGFGRCALARGQHRRGAVQLRQALDILGRIHAAEAVDVAAELLNLSRSPLTDEPA
jgi:DNA-binding SARP family transcriptional activator/tetratricopeptide (TPR) repeat protein